MLFQNTDLIVPDVGNSHWEEINIIKSSNVNKPTFLDGLGTKLTSMPIIKTPLSETTKNDLINNSQFPIFLYPHANGFCAIIGGTELKQSTKWNGYFFVGDFCAGTIWAINIENNSD